MYGCIFAAGIHVGNLFHGSQRATGLTGPFDGDRTVIHGQEVLNIYLYSSKYDQ